MKKIIVVLGILFFLFGSGLFLYEKIVFINSIPILAYHDVLENPLEETDMSIENFEAQMAYLAKHHYQTLSLDEFYDWKNGKDIKGKKVVLTFDDGKESFYTTVMPILEKYQLKATVFVIQSAINVPGYLTEEQVLDLKNKDFINVESHSYHLHGEDAAKSNNYEVYYQDMKQNKENGYNYYAYPFGISNENYVSALKDNGYKLAFLFSPSKWTNKKQENYEITRVPIYKSNSLWKFKLKVFFKI